MDRNVRRKLAMAGRVLEFARTNPSEGESWTGVVTRLEELLSRAGLVEVAEQEGRLGAREARARRRELRDRIHREMVRHLVNTVEVAFKGDPARRKGFDLPRMNGPYQRYVSLAKATLARALPVRDELVAAGLGETLLDDLGQALDAFDAADADAVVKRREHVAARQALLSLIDEVMDQVTLLDGLLRPRFRTDAELAGTWELVRAVDGPERAGRNQVVGAIGPAAAAQGGVNLPESSEAVQDGEPQDGEEQRDAV